MAITQNTLIGRSSGRIGNVVLSTWKGKNIAKQKPEIVANPRTANQQANRAKFVALMAIGRMFRPIIQIGFKEYANKMSWLNRFMSTNNEAMSYNESTNVWSPNFQLFTMAEGSLYPVVNGVTQAWNPSKNAYSLTWDPTPQANQSSQDILFAAITSGNQTFFENSREVTRDLGAYSFVDFVPDLQAGDEYFVWFFFTFEKISSFVSSIPPVSRSNALLSIISISCQCLLS